MKRVRGIVLEVNPKSLIIITPGGEFCKVAHPGGSVALGQEVSCHLKTPTWPKIAVSAAFLAAAALLMVAVLPSLPFIFTEDEPSSGYLSLDINPSLELTFDQDLQVTAFLPLNSDAVLLIEGLHPGGHLHDTISQLLERSLLLGFLESGKHDNLVLISFIQPDQGELLADVFLKLLEEKLEHMDVGGSIALVETDGKAKEEADAAGVSLNYYILREALLNEGYVDLPPDDISTEELLRALQKAGLSDLLQTVLITVPASEEPPLPSEKKKGPPDWVTPGKPDKEKPDTPGQGTPGPPDGVNPGPPEKDKPDSPGQGNPGPPDGVNPGPPEKDKPDTPGQGVPGPPEGVNPGPPENDKPDSPGQGVPGPPDGVNPGAGNKHT